MANWLQNFRPNADTQKASLPVMRRPSALSTALNPMLREGKLPNASLIYGMAASGLFVVAVYFLFTGMWFTGGLVFLPAMCFLGFALYFLKAR